MEFLVSHKYKFLLGWSAKCGCSSIKTWYLNIHELEVPADGNVHKHIGYGKTEFSHVDWDHPEIYASYKKFLVVRDPYKRLISGFVNKYVGDHYSNDGWDSFAEFVNVLADDVEFKRINRHHFTPQFSEYYDRFSEHFEFDFVAGLENLQDGLDTISHAVGAPLHSVSVFNETKHAETSLPLLHVSKWSIQELKRNRANLPKPDRFYTDDLLRQVEDIYRKDFESLHHLGISYERPKLAGVVYAVANTQTRAPIAADIPKVSVIIPVFNTAVFLSECLDSVLNQTLVNIEIIVVDDCSTDGSCQIVQGYANRDQKVQLVRHEVNLGLPATRNTGVSHATGEYIIHLDSDDFWLDLKMLEQLYTLAEVRQSDVIKFGGSQYNDGKIGKTLTRIKGMTKALFSAEDSLWNIRSTFLYFTKRSFIERHKISFNPDISIGEDQLYVAKILTLATNISAVENRYYAYRVNAESMMKRRWSVAQFLEEAAHSKIVMEMLKDFPRPLKHYAHRKLTYWLTQVFPRAFEELEQKDRLRFFEETWFLAEAFNTESSHPLADFTAKEVDFFTMLRSADALYIERNFRENINPKFSKFIRTSFKQWPAVCLHRESSTPPSKKIRGTIYIHAGTHKTGSTAIQDFLHQNNQQLLKDDIFYSVAARAWGPNSHLLPISLVDIEQDLLQFPSMNAEQIWENILADYQHSGCQDLLLSSEFFCPEYLEQELPDLGRLKQLLGDNCIKFIFYVRAQDTRLESGYAQLVHAGVRATGESLQAYTERVKKSLDYQWLLGEYEQVFGLEALKVNRYCRDDFEAGNICRDFLRQLDVNSSNYSFFNSEKNEKWPADVIGFLQENNLHNRQWNSGQKSRFGFYARHWFGEHSPGSATASEIQLDSKARKSAEDYYYTSNQAISDRYLAKGRPLEIKPPSIEAAEAHNEEPDRERVLRNLLLECWAEKDRLETQLAHLKKKNSPPRFRELLFQLKSKIVHRLKAEIKAFRRTLSYRQLVSRETFARALSLPRKFRNVENISDYNFSLTSTNKLPGLSAMLRVKNEEARIFSCLQSIYEAFDEIVLIDNGSSDRTLEIVNRFILEHDCKRKVRIEHYPFDVRRCGLENKSTDELSVHSLAYYYNWCLGKCHRTYVCKWDADMLFSAQEHQLKNVDNFLRSFGKTGKLHTGKISAQTVYIDENGKRHFSVGEINSEIRVFPNIPSVHFKKADQWESICFPKSIKTRVLEESCVEEIKDIAIDEFSHWTPGSTLSARKELELENYTLIKLGLVDVFPDRFQQEA